MKTLVENAVVDDVMKTAGEWMLRSHKGLSPQEESLFVSWLASDPRHEAAYDAVLRADRVLEKHQAAAEIMSLRASALRARPERRLGHARGAIAASVIIALVVSLLGFWAVPPFRKSVAHFFGSEQGYTASYVTASGERATVRLADGSTITLNTDSAAEVIFDSDFRRVRLIRGQALFNVAHDGRRPFQVLTHDRQVTAVGTAFDVLVLPGTLRVAMLDGVVRVSSREWSGPQTLSRGEVMTARSDGDVSVRQMDTYRLVEWRDGVIVFDDTPLSDAVAEMSRYARHPIGVADARTGALRVSGAFRVAEADTFGDAMGDVFPVRVTRSEGGRTLLTAR